MRGHAITGGEWAHKLASLTDEAVLRLMFSNLRGVVGLKLTKPGLELMRLHFEAYEVSRLMEAAVPLLHLLYLDRVATMPYHCRQDGYTFFEYRLAIKLKLADGNIGTLIEIESD